MLERETRLSVLETMLLSIAHLGSVLPSDRSRLLACATLVDHLDHGDAGIYAAVPVLFLGEFSLFCSLNMTIRHIVIAGYPSTAGSKHQVVCFQVLSMKPFTAESINVNYVDAGIFAAVLVLFLGGPLPDW